MMADEESTSPLSTSLPSSAKIVSLHLQSPRKSAKEKQAPQLLTLFGPGSSQGQPIDVVIDDTSNVAKVLSKDTVRTEPKYLSKVKEQDVSNVIAHDVSEVQAQDVSKVLAQDVSKVVSKDVSKVISKDVLKDASEVVSKTVTKDGSRVLLKAVLKDVSTLVPTDLKKGTTKVSSPVMLTLTQHGSTLPQGSKDEKTMLKPLAQESTQKKEVLNPLQQQSKSQNLHYQHPSIGISNQSKSNIIYPPDDKYYGVMESCQILGQPLGPYLQNPFAESQPTVKTEPKPPKNRVVCFACLDTHANKTTVAYRKNKWESEDVDEALMRLWNEKFEKYLDIVDKVKIGLCARCFKMILQSSYFLLKMNESLEFLDKRELETQEQTIPKQNMIYNKQNKQTTKTDKTVIEDDDREMIEMIELAPNREPRSTLLMSGMAKQSGPPVQLQDSLIPVNDKNEKDGEGNKSNNDNAGDSSKDDLLVHEILLMGKSSAGKFQSTNVFLPSGTVSKFIANSAKKLQNDEYGPSITKPSLLNLLTSQKLKVASSDGPPAKKQKTTEVPGSSSSNLSNVKLYSQKVDTNIEQHKEHGKCTDDSLNDSVGNECDMVESLRDETTAGTNEKDERELSLDIMCVENMNKPERIGGKSDGIGNKIEENINECKQIMSRIEGKLEDIDEQCDRTVDKGLIKDKCAETLGKHDDCGKVWDTSAKIMDTSQQFFNRHTKMENNVKTIAGNASSDFQMEAVHSGSASTSFASQVDTVIILDDHNYCSWKTTGHQERQDVQEQVDDKDLAEMIMVSVKEEPDQSDYIQDSSPTKGNDAQGTTETYQAGTNLKHELTEVKVEQQLDFS